MISGQIKPLLPLLISSLLAAGCANGSESSDVNPYKQPNTSWISISGTVDAIAPDRFTLDFGKDTVIVEMDDGDRDADAYQLVKGDKVTVNGRIDDDFYETTSIEANSVYVEKLNTYFYASSKDEEDFDDSVWYEIPVKVNSVSVQGYVTDIGNDEFTVNTGRHTLTIDVEGLAFDPLDDDGYVRIDKGDVVRVNGVTGEGFFRDPNLDARSVVVLYPS